MDNGAPSIRLFGVTDVFPLNVFRFNERPATVSCVT